MTGDPHPPAAAVREAVARALAEDVLPLGDLAGALVDAGTGAGALLVAREEGVLAGRRCVEESFRQVDPGVELRWHCEEGGRVAAGTAVGEVHGDLRSLLAGERTALNFVCHLSGVASLTRRFVDAVAGSGARILDTRKTTPGLRALEKAAVRAGGGHNHRGNLSELVLVKDNHLTALSPGEAVRRARDQWPLRAVEVECEALEQVLEAVAAGASGVLLDNMTADEVRRCVAEVCGRAFVEVSGGVTLETVAAYAAAGPDFISVGALTHSAPILDVGLDLEG